MTKEGRTRKQMGFDLDAHHTRVLPSCKTFPRRFTKSGCYVFAAVGPAGLGTVLLLDR